MATREAQGTLPDPIFFGLMEGLCFLCLFCSPFLSLPHPLMAWIMVALLRVVILGVVVLPARAAAQPPARGRDASATLRFLGQSLFYQIPFWCSALLFPLQAGQGDLAATALGLQTALLLLLPPLANWRRPFGAESLVFSLTVMWSMIWLPPGPWLGLAVLAFPLTWRGLRPLRGWGWELGLGQGLAIGVLWLAAIALPRMGPATSIPPAPPLLFWALLLYAGAVMGELQRETEVNGEVESALPRPRKARLWRIGRRSGSILLGWTAPVLLVLARPQEWLGLLLWGAAVWRAAELASRRWLDPERLVWWTALETTVIWFALRAALEVSVATLALSLVLTARLHWLVRDRSDISGLSSWPGWSRTEQTLVGGLLLAAPPGFAARVMPQTESSVELEKSHLAASAPAGFRERLMARLKASEEAED